MPRELISIDDNGLDLSFFLLSG